MTAAKSLRLAVDIGGTFTDTVLARDDEIIASSKTLTTHQNPALGAIEGTERVMDQTQYGLEDVTGFIHGTTLATNALIERRGAIVATITTEGFRDILEIAYERRYDQYDIGLEKPDLLVPRERCLTVRERMSVDGEVLIPLDESAIDGLVTQIDESGANAIAICLLHAYANAEHEIRLRDRLLEARPHLTISISCEVSPEAREFDRLCTTVANVYIQPLMEGYLHQFQQHFSASGLQCPILMMTAGGGMTTIDTAARFPIRLVESGPAGGAIMAAQIAASTGHDEVLSFDVGGTTAKLCLIDQARPQTSRQFEIARAARFIKGSGMPVRIPVVEMIEIGAGGGSIAGVDRVGRLTVGPKSAGSEPGPVAFGRGGTEPTVTDSDVTLGYIVPESFAEGQFVLQADAAAKALVEKIGRSLDLDAGQSADGVSRIVDESMASAGRMHAVESGKDLGNRTMIAFGGNGPLHATRVARSAGVSRILVPRNPSVGSAIGFLYAPISFEIVRSQHTLLNWMDVEAINTLLDAMIAEAQAVVRRGAGDAPTTTARTGFMRYSGQGHEIEVPLPDRAVTVEDIGPMTEAFEADYRKQFSRPVPDMEIEILNWAVRVSTVQPPVQKVGSMPEPNRKEPSSYRPIICDVDGTKKDAAVVPRDGLAPGDEVTGPALITEPQTTTLVSADFTARVDSIGNLVLVRHHQEAH